jgi:prophage DNA circulation protein
MTQTDFANSVQAFVNAIVAAVPNPATALNILGQLTNVPVDTTLSSSAIGQAQLTLEQGIADLFRRTVVAAMGQVGSYYQPISYDDAAATRTLICGYIDNEITIAGDQGEDDVYQALITLRNAVIQDLTTRGANLAPLASFTVKSNMPALALAYRLYQDISRVDQLVNFADPIHPAFMPTTFKALSQ